jgi:hypothetical protein
VSDFQITAFYALLLAFFLLKLNVHTYTKPWLKKLSWQYMWICLVVSLAAHLVGVFERLSA